MVFGPQPGERNLGPKPRFKIDFTSFSIRAGRIKQTFSRPYAQPAERRNRCILKKHGGRNRSFHPGCCPSPRSVWDCTSDRLEFSVPLAMKVTIG